MQKKVIKYENKKWIIHNKIVESHLQKLQCFLKNDNKIDNSILLQKESERSSFIYNNLIYNSSCFCRDFPANAGIGIIAAEFEGYYLFLWTEAKNSDIIHGCGVLRLAGH